MIRYAMTHPITGRRHWLTEAGCAQALDRGWGDGGVALDTDTWAERPLTEVEKQRITSLSDEISGSQ